MSKMTIDQAYNQNNKKATDYFRLINDGDTARIRFMYKSLNEIETFAVHVIDINGKKYTVDCLKDADGQGDCPFCSNNMPRRIQTYFKIFNEDLKVPQIWTRGIKAASVIENGLKMSRSKEICQDVYKVTRKGIPGDINTQYQLEFESYDNIELSSLPVAVNLDESNVRFIIKASVEDMNYYLKNKTLPMIESKQENTPAETTIQRRTPNRF